MQSRRSQLAVALLLALGPCAASAAYFHVHEGEEKCFVEIVPDQVVLTVKYKHVENPGVGCMLVFKDARGKQVFSKRIGPEEREQGQATYMSQKSGQHRICVQCQGSKWFQTTPLQWELHVDKGDTELLKSPLSKGEFRGVERIVLSTEARAEAIAAENEYEKTTESDFWNASERMDSHVVWVSLFIMCMECGVVVWQVSHLRRFFKGEKLI